jgi:hypothetical protein
MDLSPLVMDDSISPEEYALGYVKRLEEDVQERIKRYL